MIEVKHVYIENGVCKAKSDYIPMYTKAKYTSDIIRCFIAKLFGRDVVDVFGRIVLLPSDYEKVNSD